MCGIARSWCAFNRLDTVTLRAAGFELPAGKILTDFCVRRFLHSLRVMTVNPMNRVRGDQSQPGRWKPHKLISVPHRKSHCVEFDFSAATKRGTP
jgi:hypothetical protein